jgi:hypothetical protein
MLSVRIMYPLVVLQHPVISIAIIVTYCHDRYSIVNTCQELSYLHMLHFFPLLTIRRIDFDYTYC